MKKSENHFPVHKNVTKPYELLDISSIYLREDLRKGKPIANTSMFNYQKNITKPPKEGVKMQRLNNMKEKFNQGEKEKNGLYPIKVEKIAKVKLGDKNVDVYDVKNGRHRTVLSISRGFKRIPVEKEENKKIEEVGPRKPPTQIIWQPQIASQTDQSIIKKTKNMNTFPKKVKTQKSKGKRIAAGKK